MSETKISWLPWNKESFLKAKEQDKPILLGISAVWCHWCHVMDKTTYSDNEVARLIQELFVPIRVDRDRRPDIDKRYNMGGWPSTALLTPEGEVLTGGTYIPPQQMIALLEQVSLIYKKNKGKMKSTINELKQQIKKPTGKRGLNNESLQYIVENLILEIASQFDTLHGGFGNAPKFPHSSALSLALLYNQLKRHKAALTVVKKTLTEMGSGGIYDKEEGGFFRYSTTRDWSVPHYEKMCEDNAKLLVNYLEAYQVTGEKSFKDTAEGILEYVNSKLRDKKIGGFYGSQDADEVYYKLSLPERKKRTAPRIDQTIYVNWNAIMISSYLLASIVLEEQSHQNFALQTANMLLEKAFSPNNGMNHYIIDEESHLSGLLTDQIYMTKCLVDCYQASQDKKFLDKGEILVQFMINTLWDNKEGGFYDKPKESGAFGALKLSDKPFEENSVAIDSFLRLYHLTGKKQYFDIAKKTLEAFSSEYQRYGIMGAKYALAIELYLHPIPIHIIGSRKKDLTNQFLKEALRTYNPLKTVEVVDPDRNEERLKSLEYPVTRTPTVYVCFKGTCKSLEDPKNMAEVIRGKTDGS